MPSTSRIFVDNLATVSCENAPQRGRTGRRCKGAGCSTLLSTYNLSSLCEICRRKKARASERPGTPIEYRRHSTAFTLSRPTSTLLESPYARLAEITRQAFKGIRHPGYRDVAVYAFLLLLKEEGLSTQQIMGITLHKEESSTQTAVLRARELQNESEPFRKVLKRAQMEWVQAKTK